MTVHYLEKIAQDINAELSTVLKARAMTAISSKLPDGSYRIAFRNIEVGLGSDIALKVLPQMVTNQLYATWESIRLERLTPTEVKILGPDRLVYAPHNDRFKVKSEELFDILSRTSLRDSALLQLKGLLLQETFANFADVNDRFHQRATNPLIPEVFEQVTEMLAARSDVDMQLKRWPGKFNVIMRLTGPYLTAFLSFNDSEVSLNIAHRPAGRVSRERLPTLFRKLKCYIDGDTTKNSPIVVRNALQFHEEMRNRDAEIEAREREAMQTRAYLQALPIADEKHVHREGKTESYLLRKGHNPWPTGAKRCQEYVLINDNKLIAVVGVLDNELASTHLLGNPHPTETQWKVIKEFCSSHNFEITQRPDLFDGVLVDASGEAHRMSSLQSDLIFDTSLDLRDAAAPFQLPPNLTVHGMLQIPRHSHSLPGNLRAHTLDVSGSNVTAIRGDVEVTHLMASRSKIEKIENGFKAKHVDLSTTTKLCSLPDDFEVETMNLSGSWLRFLPKRLTVNELNLLKAFYITEIPDCTRLHGKIVGDGSQVENEHGETPGLKW